MRFLRLGKRAAAAATAALVASALAAAPADAHSKTKPLGTRSLAAVLTAHTSGFDRNGGDFDILQSDRGLRGIRTHRIRRTPRTGTSEYSTRRRRAP